MTQKKDPIRYELLTLDGGKILERLMLLDAHGIADQTVRCDVDVTLSDEEYDESALLYQLKKQILSVDPQAVIDRSALRHLLVYINFTDAFPLESRTWFDRMFEEGFWASFPHSDTPAQRFVPFQSSQSQSKKHIFAFIREDLFAPMQQRLNLDIPFESNMENNHLARLTKLYAYRGLYSSAATPILHGQDAGADAFFNEENIIVMPDEPHKPDTPVPVFTSTQAKPVDGTNEIVIRPCDGEQAVKIERFDGVGLISPAGHELINARLPKRMRGRSFQVRMPFFKGVLHTVNFHQFLRDSGVTGEHAYVIDYFGQKRDLFRANIIVTPSIFKLISLPHGMKKDDLMRHYFDCIKKYDHGLYVVQTESVCRHTQYVRLNSQLLSTLDLSSEDIDGLVQNHIRQADAFCVENLTDPEERKKLFAIADRSDWMDLLLREPRFIHDKHIQTLIEGYRLSRYKDIALGRLRVQGENRFLSGDLFYFLMRLLKHTAITDNRPELKEVYDEYAKRRLKYGAVYIPQATADVKRVALLRNPHLSRNEDVGTVVASNKLHPGYRQFLGELKGVVFVGDLSYIPAAMGGADFDGDHINIVYDERIVNACFRSGYVELRDRKSPVPFIHIPSLQADEQSMPSRYIRPCYISAQVVYNTFSSRIGEISNAAMKIAAVEYDECLPRPDFSAALCTILTGNEIDATKKGVRPRIRDVVQYTGKGDEQQERIVNEVSQYIRVKKALKSWSGSRIPKIKRVDDVLSVEDKDLTVKTICANREHATVTQLLYRWAEAYLRMQKRQKSARTRKTDDLAAIFDTENTAAEQTDRILHNYEKTCCKYANRQARRKSADKKISQMSAKSCVRLKGQYDNIYLPTDGQLSYWDRYCHLQEEILNLTEIYPVEDFRALSDRLFSQTEDTFDPHTFWPYAHAAAVTEMPLYKDLMRLPYAEMLHNFDCEGYRLLYYALNSAIEYASMPMAEDPQIDDKQYIACYRRNANAAKASTVFRRDLTALVRQDLQTAFAGADISAVIRHIYPLRTTQQLFSFWELFSVREVLDALGGDDDAE